MEDFEKFGLSGLKMRTMRIVVPELIWEELQKRGQSGRFNEIVNNMLVDYLSNSDTNGKNGKKDGGGYNYLGNYIKSDNGSDMNTKDGNEENCPELIGMKKDNLIDQRTGKKKAY